MDFETSNKNEINIILANPQGKLNSNNRNNDSIRDGALFNENLPLKVDFSKYLYTINIWKNID